MPGQTAGDSADALSSRSSRITEDGAKSSAGRARGRGKGRALARGSGSGNGDGNGRGGNGRGRGPAAPCQEVRQESSGKSGSGKGKMSDSDRAKKKERARRKRKRRIQKQVAAFIGEIVDELIDRACNGGAVAVAGSSGTKFSADAPEFSVPPSLSNAMSNVNSGVRESFPSEVEVTGRYGHAAQFQHANHFFVTNGALQGRAPMGMTSNVGRIDQYFIPSTHLTTDVPPITNVSVATSAYSDIPIAGAVRGAASIGFQPTAIPSLTTSRRSGHVQHQRQQQHVEHDYGTPVPPVLRVSVSNGLDEFVPKSNAINGNVGDLADSELNEGAEMLSGRGAESVGTNDAGHSSQEEFNDVIVAAHDEDEEDEERRSAAFSECDEWLLDTSKPIQLLLDAGADIVKAEQAEKQHQRALKASALRTNTASASNTSASPAAPPLDREAAAAALMPKQADAKSEKVYAIENNEEFGTPLPSTNQPSGSGDSHQQHQMRQIPRLDLKAHVATSQDEWNNESVRASLSAALSKVDPPPPLHQLIMHFLTPWECGRVASVCKAWREWMETGFALKHHFEPTNTVEDPMVSPLHPPPPTTWDVAPERHWMLHAQVLDMAHSFTKIARSRRPWQVAVVNATRVAILQLWPGARVEIFGSFAQGLAGPGSDVDLVVCDVLAHYEWIMQGGKSKVRERPRGSCAEQLGRHLQSLDWVQTVTVISSANVPVIKVSTAFQETGRGGISLDISFDGPKHRGIVTCALVAQLQSCYPCLRPLVLVLKHLLITKGLNQTYLGGISSYGLVLMVTAVLQLWDQHFYNEPKNLGTLLIFFLYIYGVLFHPAHYGIAILLTRDAMDSGHGGTAKPSFSSVGPFYLRHTSRHRMALQRFFQARAPHLLIPPKKAPGTQVVRDVDILEHVRRIVNSYSQRQPGALYLDLRKRFGVEPGPELSMADELIFVNSQWAVDPLELMDPFDHRNNLGSQCFGMLPLGAELAAAFKRVQNVQLYQGSTVLGAVFSSQEEGSDHRHLIQLQQKLWSAPTDAKNTAAAHGAHSVSDMLDTPSTLPDNSTEYRHSPRTANGEGSKEVGAPASQPSNTDATQRGSQDLGVRGSDSNGSAIAGNINDGQTLSLTRTPSAQSIGETIVAANSTSSAGMATQMTRSGATGGSTPAGSASVPSIDPRRRSSSSDARDRPEKLLPHAVPSVVTPRLPEQASVVATQAKLVLEAMISRSLLVTDGVRQVFSSNPVPTAPGDDSPVGTRIQWWDMDWLARYMVHTHCSHTAIQQLLLEITLEFDRFSEAAGVLPRRSKWSQLVLKQSVEYALTLLSSTSILTDDRTRHDLKACG
eukprot:INCI7198.3.p1 GENE.INCI7198.3~~INCI7198.3.p1  ORF type:complete len:1333 (+),score=224.12 INCI7198.3:281-4279(+)